MQNYTVHIVNRVNQKLIRKQVIQEENIQAAMNSDELNLNRWEAVKGATESTTHDTTPKTATSLGSEW